MATYTYFINAGPTQHALHASKIAKSLKAALDALESLWGNDIDRDNFKCYRIIQRKDDVDTLLVTDTAAKAFTTFNSKLEALTHRKPKGMTHETVMERTLERFGWHVEPLNGLFRVRCGTTVHADRLDYDSALLYAKTLAAIGVDTSKDFKAAPALYPPYKNSLRWGADTFDRNTIPKAGWKGAFLERFKDNFVIKFTL